MRKSFATLMFCLLAVVSCGDDDGSGSFVGAPCRDVYDCGRGAQCERGGDFPDGLCTYACRDHFDCPQGSACIDHKGGLCMPNCRANLDCRGGYECKEKDDRGDNGKSLVCSK